MTSGGWLRENASAPAESETTHECPNTEVGPLCPRVAWFCAGFDPITMSVSCVVDSCFFSKLTSCLAPPAFGLRGWISFFPHRKRCSLYKTPPSLYYFHSRRNEQRQTHIFAFPSLCGLASLCIHTLLVLFGVCCLQKSNRIALEKDPSHLGAFATDYLDGILERHVHVLIKADYLSFYLQFGVFVQPKNNPCLFLFFGTRSSSSKT